MKKFVTELTPAIEEFIGRKFGDYYQDFDGEQFFHFPNYNDGIGFKEGFHLRELKYLFSGYELVSEAGFLAEFDNQKINSGIKVEILQNDFLTIPKYETSQSAGMDVYARILEEYDGLPELVKSSYHLEPGNSVLIKTGLFLAVPDGYEIQVRPRSGLALKNQITVLNTPGTIDADYRGEIGVILINHGKSPFKIEHGSRIAQIVLNKVEKINWTLVEKLSETERGSGGFGSTGNK